MSINHHVLNMPVFRKIQKELKLQQGTETYTSENPNSSDIFCLI